MGLNHIIIKNDLLWIPLFTGQHGAKQLLKL